MTMQNQFGKLAKVSTNLSYVAAKPSQFARELTDQEIGAIAGGTLPVSQRPTLPILHNPIVVSSPVSPW